MPDNFGRMTSDEAPQSLKDFCFPKPRRRRRDMNEVTREEMLAVLDAILYGFALSDSEERILRAIRSRLTERQRENEIKEALRQATKCMAGMLPLVGDKKIQDLYRQALDGLESVLFKGIRADDVKEADHD